jgi:SAM-dependent methyltransferase
MIVAVIFYVALGVGSFSGCRFISFESTSFPSRTLLKFQEQDSSYNLSQFKSLITAHQYRRLYKLLERYISPGGEVLDWGCGNGHFSYFLSKFGYKAFGFSFNDFPFRQVLNSGYEFNKGSCEDPTTLPYPDQKFDAVVSVGVLEHVRETGGSEVGSLREIFRILKFDGVFVCYHFPNQYSLIEFIASLLSNKYHHQYRYTRQSIETLCQREFGLSRGEQIMVNCNRWLLRLVTISD